MDKSYSMCFQVLTHLILKTTVVDLIIGSISSPLLASTTFSQPHPGKDVFPTP